MRTEQHYKWRIQWAGKWTTTGYHCSEENIRKEHPEAVRIDGTLIEREIPETQAEVIERLRSTSTGVLQNPNQFKVPEQFLSSFDPKDVPF